MSTLTGEGVSAQTVSRLIRDLDEAVCEFPRAPLADEWAYLLLDGVSLRVRRPTGRKRVQMLVAYGVRHQRCWVHKMLVKGRPISEVLETTASCTIIGPARNALRPPAGFGKGTRHSDWVKGTRHSCV